MVALRVALSRRWRVVSCRCRGPTYFLLLAQEKVGKEKGTLHGALRSFAAAGT